MDKLLRQRRARLALLILTLMAFHLPFIPSVRAVSLSQWLNCNAFSSTYTGWTALGSSPYLNAQDGDIISTSTSNAQEGWFNFGDTTLTGTLVLNISIYCSQSGGTNNWATVYADYTGSGSGSSIGNIAQHTASQYDTISQGTKTAADVNNLRVYFRYIKSGGAKTITIDHARLGVNSAIYNVNAGGPYSVGGTISVTWINYPEGNFLTAGENYINVEYFDQQLSQSLAIHSLGKTATFDTYGPISKDQAGHTILAYVYTALDQTKDRNSYITRGDPWPATCSVNALTLLTFKDKYVISSTTAVTTTSTILQDDTQASQTFSLSSSQTVLAIYQANSVHGALIPQAYGMQNAIWVDSTDYAKSWDSGVISHRATRNTVFWIGTLAAGSHTIKGRFASGSSGSTATVSNRVLLIYILNGDAFYYVDSSTNSTTSGTSFADDPAAQFTFTPSGSCKALILYNVANYYSSGQNENENGKKVAIWVGGTDYSQAEKSPYDDTYPDSVFTAWALGLSASSTTVKGRFACSIASSVYINRRQLGVLLFADDTLLDTVNSDTQVSTTSSTLQDDSQATISRTTGDARELLVVAMGTKRYGTSDSINGSCYGIKIDSNDRANSRGSPHTGGVYANSAATAYAEYLAAGGHTIKGRFATNYAGDTTKIDSRRIMALWLTCPQPTVPEFPLGVLLPLLTGFAILSIRKRQ